MKLDRRTFLRSISGTIATTGIIGSGGTAAAAGSYTNHYYSGFDYWKYVPDSAGTDSPLVVMLHGCTQDADEFRVETGMNEVADREGFVVIYPDQYNARNSEQCWNWFYDSNTTRENGEAAVIAGMTQETIDAHDLDEERVYVAGLSAGGAMVPNLLAEYADIFAAGGIHSALEYDAADSASGATVAMDYGGPDPYEKGIDAYDAMEYYGITSRLPTIVFHGTADRTVAPINGDQATIQAIQTNDLASDGRNDDNVDTTADSVTNGQSESFSYTVSEYHDESGNSLVEYWEIDGMGHAWSGGTVGGEYTAPGGPDANQRMWEFFAQHTRSE
ncbi:extracellular catalytic domain type 1 short-chain-length polyhydroxyalkanoate depolymerase [Haladaptatus caseinilyticus]|uniref:extracellular catalytic domain type 1 short-chain-length polyhydroxyalkanoate depolymerase n=1 Tax=Haladaptatus caseinilyticus TaxID=2993314 RepID=UPI00224A6FE0|nr:PHB depolymerase family esterase [Haladaptatus caseinilyticus]